MLAIIGLLLVVAGVFCIIRGMQGSSPFNLLPGEPIIKTPIGEPTNPVREG